MKIWWHADRRVWRTQIGVAGEQAKRDWLQEACSRPQLRLIWIADIEPRRSHNHELAALVGAVALAGKLVKKVVMPASRIPTPISMVA